MLTSSAACLACWAVELWKLGPLVVAGKRGVNHGQSRSVRDVDYSLLNCTSLTVNGAVTERQFCRSLLAVIVLHISRSTYA